MTLLLLLRNAAQDTSDNQPAFLQGSQDTSSSTGAYLRGWFPLIDGFESGDLSAWNGTGTTAPTISGTAAIDGSYGMELPYDAVDEYAKLEWGTGPQTFYVKFKIDTNDIYGSGGDWIDLFVLNDGTVSDYYGGIEYTFISGGSVFQIAVSIYNDSHSGNGQLKSDIPVGEHTIECEWTFQASTGGLRWWIDGEEQTSITNVDSGNVYPDWAYLGNYYDPGSQQLDSGTIYLDSFAIYDTERPFISDSTAAYLKGQETANSSIEAWLKGSSTSSDNTSAFLEGYGERLHPDGDVSKTGLWKRDDNSTTNLYLAIDEYPYNDSDYVWYDNTVEGRYFEVSLENPDNPTIGSGDVIIYWRARRRAGTETATIKVELREGATIRASDSQTITDSDTEYSYTLTSGEKASITNWNDLRLRFIVETVA